MELPQSPDKSDSKLRSETFEQPITDQQTHTTQQDQSIPQSNVPIANTNQIFQPYPFHSTPGLFPPVYPPNPTSSFGVNPNYPVVSPGGPFSVNSSGTYSSGTYSSGSYGVNPPGSSFGHSNYPGSGGLTPGGGFGVNTSGSYTGPGSYSSAGSFGVPSSYGSGTLPGQVSYPGSGSMFGPAYQLSHSPLSGPRKDPSKDPSHRNNKQTATHSHDQSSAPSSPSPSSNHSNSSELNNNHNSNGDNRLHSLDKPSTLPRPTKKSTLKSNSNQNVQPIRAPPPKSIANYVNHSLSRFSFSPFLPFPLVQAGISFWLFFLLSFRSSLLSFPLYINDKQILIFVKRQLEIFLE